MEHFYFQQICEKSMSVQEQSIVRTISPSANENQIDRDKDKKVKKAATPKRNLIPNNQHRKRKKKHKLFLAEEPKKEGPSEDTEKQWGVLLLGGRWEGFEVECQPRMTNRGNMSGAVGRREKSWLVKKVHDIGRKRWVQESFQRSSFRVGKIRGRGISVDGRYHGIGGRNQDRINP